MRCTTLRITEAGVVLLEGHARRMAPEGGPMRTAFLHQVAQLHPGIHLITLDGERWSTTPRSASWLTEGMPVRHRISPVTHRGSPFPKPPSPGPYDTVRKAGVATLLTSADGAEIYEACVAAVVGWDGSTLVLPPEHCPRVASVSEAAVAEHLGVCRASVASAGTMPLLLINAVKGTCEADAGREPFPAHVRASMDALFRELTAWP